MQLLKREKLGGQKIYSRLSLRLREGGFILLLATSLFLVIALITYHTGDPGWSQTGSGQTVLNAAGRMGAWLADFFLYLFGYLAFVFPIMLICLSWLILREGYYQGFGDLGLLSLRLGGFLLFMVAGDGLINLLWQHFPTHLPFRAGGILGVSIQGYLSREVNFVGALIILLPSVLVGLTLAIGVSWFGLFEHLGELSWRIGYFLWQRLCSGAVLFSQAILKLPAQFKKHYLARQAKPKPAVSHFMGSATPTSPTVALTPKKNSPSREIPISRLAPSVSTPNEQGLSASSRRFPKGLPSLDLLDEATSSDYPKLPPEALRELSKAVEARLADFGIKANVVAVHPGPVITRFELSLAPGVKVSKITTLDKDLARSLSTISVRVVEVIPGKAVVGLEIPNAHRKVVRLKEILASHQYKQARSPLSLALGADIGGHPVVIDIAKMPHLLVAGTTGAGKSVSINVMLLSLLYKATPEEVRLILVDPKMLELSVYEGIPHLLTPVVTDMKDAANALRWCVAEMDRRYRLMASQGVRNLMGYNEKIAAAEKASQPIIDPFVERSEGDEAVYLTPLPFIVVVIDEFADMMMVVGKKVEELIARIAQKARAAGIHLVLATQRPSVDVITGLIKSNIPTRIAFQVSSRIDSRTILDQSGAEQLLGHGDMLYLPPGSGVPVRVHGAFVDDQEVHRVVADWKRRAKANYLPDILVSHESFDGEEGQGILSELDEDDPLYDQAVAIVTQSRRASISSVQRRLKIGYNRAARLVETMEAVGIVGPMTGSGVREVLAPAPPEG